MRKPSVTAVITWQQLNVELYFPDAEGLTRPSFSMAGLCHFASMYSPGTRTRGNQYCACVDLLQDERDIELMYLCYETITFYPRHFGRDC